MMNKIPETLLEAVRYFANPEVCTQFLAEIRWPDGVHCPRKDCGGTEVWTINSKTRGMIWRCKTCRKQFTVRVGTIRKGELQRRIARHVALGSTIYSDALKSYDGLEERYAHEVINHAEAFVRGRVHTNGLENFWSLFKLLIPMKVGSDSDLIPV